MASALVSNIFRPHVHLLGGSGGCYALLGAQLSTLILNWHEDHAIIFPRCRAQRIPKVYHGKLIRSLKLFGLLLYILVDIFLFLQSPNYSVSYEAHFAGFICGLLLALLIAHDRVEQRWERAMKVAAAITLITLIGVGVLCNFGLINIR